MTVFERLKLGLGIFTRPTAVVPATRRRAAPLAQEKGQEGSPYHEMGLAALLEEIGPLPPLSVVIGACEDGLHFYMDLSDPRPGPVLVAGEAGCGKTRLLRSILAAALAGNGHRQVRYALAADNLVEYQALSQRPHCYRALKTGTRAALDLLGELAGLAEQRQGKPAPAPTILLALDDLASLYAGLDAQGLQNLAWLLVHGPQARIWPFATLRAEEVEYVDDAILQGFHTRLLGRMPPSPAADYLAVYRGPMADLVSGAQFCVRFDNEWLDFWVTDPEEVL